MPRPREFDAQQALRKALRLFWRKGYADTSMRDIVEATGVAHAGIYAAFGSKRGLYVQALHRYAAIVIDRLLRDMESPDASRTSIEAFFELLVEISADGDFRNGCLMVNTAVEFGANDVEMRTLYDQHMARITTAFEHALRNAVLNGEVPRQLDPAATAQFFTLFFNGLTVMTRAGRMPDELQLSIDVALQVLD